MYNGGIKPDLDIHLANRAYQCTGHVENPYSEYTGVFHFATEHHQSVTGTFTLLHLVFNIKSPYLRALFLVHFLCERRAGAMQN